MSHTVTIVQDSAIYQLIKYGTKLEYHSRWDETHRNMCGDCYNGYIDHMLETEEDSEDE